MLVAELLEEQSLHLLTRDYIDLIGYCCSLQIHCQSHSVLWLHCNRTCSQLVLPKSVIIKTDNLFRLHMSDDVVMLQYVIWSRYRSLALNDDDLVEY